MSRLGLFDLVIVRDFMLMCVLGVFTPVPLM